MYERQPRRKWLMCIVKNTGACFLYELQIPSHLLLPRSSEIVAAISGSLVVHPSDMAGGLIETDILSRLSRPDFTRCVCHKLKEEGSSY